MGFNDPQEDILDGDGVASGDIDLNFNKLILDEDGDTYIWTNNADDGVYFVVGDGIATRFLNNVFWLWNTTRIVGVSVPVVIGNAASTSNGLLVGSTIFGADANSKSAEFTGDAYFNSRQINDGTKVWKKVKTGLTDGASNDFVRIAVAQGGHVAGVIKYAIHCDDGTDQQVLSGALLFNMVNKAGTETGQTTIVAELDNAPIGTLTAAFGINSNAADTMDIDVTPTSSLTPTTLEIHYEVEVDSDVTVTDL